MRARLAAAAARLVLHSPSLEVRRGEVGRGGPPARAPTPALSNLIARICHSWRAPKPIAPSNIHSPLFPRLFFFPFRLLLSRTSKTTPLFRLLLSLPAILPVHHYNSDSENSPHSLLTTVLRFGARSRPHVQG